MHPCSPLSKRDFWLMEHIFPVPSSSVYRESTVYSKCEGLPSVSVRRNGLTEVLHGAFHKLLKQVHGRWQAATTSMPPRGGFLFKACREGRFDATHPSGATGFSREYFQQCVQFASTVCTLNKPHVVRKLSLPHRAIVTMGISSTWDLWNTTKVCSRS